MESPPVTNSSDTRNMTTAETSPSVDSTTDVSSTDWEDHYLLWFFLDLLLALFILFTNGLTVVAVGTTRSLRTQANMQVVSLAVADMLAGIYLLLDAAWLLPASGRSFHQEARVLCVAKNVVLYLCLGSSMLTMTCIAVDKLLYLATPFLYERLVTCRRTLLVIALTWLLAVLYGTAVVYANVFHSSVGCLVHDVLSSQFVFFGNTTPVALAVVVITGCYLEIVRVVAKQRRKIQALHQPCDQARDSYKKSLKLFLTVLGVFVFCWVPFVVEGFVRYVSDQYNVCHRAFLLQALLSCGLNFFSYSWQNKDLRAACRRLLVRGWYIVRRERKRFGVGVTGGEA